MDVAFISERLPTFTLVLARVSGILFIAPPFGGSAVPPLVRGLLALVLALVALPVVPVWTGSDPWAFGAAALAEVTIGLSVGVLSMLLLLAVQGAGDLLDIELGFGVASVVDPQFQLPMPLLGNFLNIVALLLFLSVDGHLWVLRALLDSFRAIPPGGGAWEPALFAGIVEAFAWVIVTAVRISLPVIGVLFLTTVALGIVARTMPQLNVFVVGLPLRVALGILVLAMVLPLLAGLLSDGVATVLGYIDAFLRGLAGGGTP
ncbi:MAG TPA: flagellar biosynthetic protein FliR [Bacillota bacterium]